jgi:hypothetical protein
MPGGWSARQRGRERARAALNRPMLTDPGPSDPVPVPRDPFVDHPPLRTMQHPTWWHVYRLEPTGPVLIAECRLECAALFVMQRERWQTRLMKWQRASFDNFHPRKPGA